MRPRLDGIVLGALLAGCPARRPAEPAARADDITARAEQQLAPRSELEPLELPPAQRPPAAWLDTESVHDDDALGANPPELERVESLYVGAHAALGRIGDSVFGFYEGRGITGPLAVPEAARWLGIDGDLNVLAADDAGRLARASLLQAAHSDDVLTPLGAVPDAIAWDVNGVYVATATSWSVWLSNDSGRTFHELGRENEDPIARVFVRSDGVVVAQSGGADERARTTWIAGRGRGLHLSRLQPSELTRTGDRIVARAPCGPVLSSDGVRWSSDAGGADFDMAAWTRVFALDDAPAGVTRDFRPASELVPPAPPTPATEPSWNRRCAHRTRSPRVRMGASVGSESRCSCAAYLGGRVDPEPAPARHALALFSDGRCSPEYEDTAAAHAETCRHDAPFTRQPKVAVVDRSSGTVIAVPPPVGCRPQALLSKGGIGVLICAPDPASTRSAIYVGDAEGRFFAEADIDVETALVARHLAMAPDGTLLLRTGWDGGRRRRAFVRSPAPLGDRGAWREIDVRDAVEVRVDVGGAALLVVTSRKVPCPGSFDLIRDAPESPRIRVAAEVAVQGSLLDVVVRGRRVLVSQTQELTTNRCALRSEDAEEGPMYAVTRRGTLVVSDSQ